MPLIHIEIRKDAKQKHKKNFLKETKCDAVKIRK